MLGPLQIDAQVDAFARLEHLVGRLSVAVGRRTDSTQKSLRAGDPLSGSGAAGALEPLRGRRRLARPRLTCAYSPAARSARAESCRSLLPMSPACTTTSHFITGPPILCRNDELIAAAAGSSKGLSDRQHRTFLEYLHKLARPSCRRGGTAEHRKSIALHRRLRRPPS